MRKIILISVFFAVISLVFSCKTQEKVVVTKNHVLSDTLIKHETRTVQPLQRNYVVYNNPCKENELVIPDQEIKDEKSSLNIRNEDGKLVIEQNIDSIVNVRVKEKMLHTEKQAEYIEKVVVKKVKRPLNWYLLGYSILATIWIFRKPLWKFIKSLIFPLPI